MTDNVINIEVDKVSLMKMLLKGNGVKLPVIKEEEKLKGTQILESVIRQLKMEIPELVLALNIFKLYPVNLPINISTDFKRLYFSPKKMISLHEKGKDDEIKFQLMHVCLHGLLGDAKRANEKRQTKTLWLTLDQRVNDICEQMGMRSDNKDLHFYMKQMRENAPYKGCFGNPFLAEKNVKVRKKSKAAQRLIAVDEHFFWSPKFIQVLLGEEPEEEEGENSKKWNDVSRIFTEETSNSQDSQTSDKGLAKKLNDLKKQHGKGAGTAKYVIEEAPGRALDYKSILSKLLRDLEDPREVPDSIDPMFYQYGLDVYGDVPLIEPKEGDEIKKLNTICLAIDTSGSCSGEVAKKFLRETKALIKDSMDMVGGGEILIIQCDDAIQDETVISLDNWDNYREEEDREFYGFGGTSFIPVFERLTELEEADKKIDALIYLTDGYGDYPEACPDYPTIFVLTDDAIDEEYVPNWIQVGTLND